MRPELVRQARAEAGLSLAQVAGQELTRAAVHLIETGRARPSMPTLELIAARTGKPLSFFLASADGAGAPGGAATNAMDNIVDLFEREDFAGVVDAASNLLFRMQDDWARARVLFYLGAAQAAMWRPSEAIDNLRQARALFERLGDGWMAVECLDAEAAALGRQRDPGSVELATQALERCRALQPVPRDVESRILAHLGAMCIDRQEWTRAIEFFEAAVAAAGSVTDLRGRAQMFEGLSIAYQVLGDGPRALQYQQKARTLIAVVRDQAALARTENNLAGLLMLQGDLTGAEEQVNSSLARLEDLNLETMRARVLLTKAELELRRGALQEAENWIEQAGDLARQLDDRATAAEVHVLRGRVAAAGRERARTDHEFGAAIALLTELNARERLIECHTAYARVLEEFGDSGAAMAQWKLAVAVDRPQLVEEPAAQSSGAAGRTA